MALGLIGEKLGMTRIFTEDGASIPVTVVEVQPNRVTQLKSPETDGYLAVQVTSGERHRNRINKAMAGVYRKAKLETGRELVRIWSPGIGRSDSCFPMMGVAFMSVIMMDS